MQKFTFIKGIPAHLPIVNIDTDMIIPKQFLKTIKRTGLGKSLFYEMRYDENENKISDFILNKEPYNKSKILLAGKNFGCGSSREHAPWALSDFGIKCVISASFADIFYNNCFKNGILPIAIPEDQIKEEKDIIAKQSENDGKPKEVMDKIIEGKITSFFQDNVLNEQTFCNPEFYEGQVGTMIEELSGKLGEKIYIKKFSRLEVGA